MKAFTAFSVLLLYKDWSKCVIVQHNKLERKRCLLGFLDVEAGVSTSSDFRFIAEKRKTS